MFNEEEQRDLERQAKILLSSIIRPGTADLMNWLEKNSDYFKAPASSNFHGAYPGGLIEHSMNVTKLLEEKVKFFDFPYTQETIVLCGMFHDLCKVNFYKIDEDDATDKQKGYLDILLRKTGHQLALKGKMNKAYCGDLIGWLKDGRKGPEPEYRYNYVFDDQLPMGHGEKSVFMLERHLALIDEEAIAIRWHMVAFDAGIHFNYPSGFPFQQAMTQYPLATLLFTADFEASNICEADRSKWKLGTTT